ncbi:MAG TPA: transcriptional regulator [Allosphingosinicella sp.]|jgi:HTH-type transcriptional regulator/antitoxin HigA|uniref:helix-turn-helix domain-containing protein n=1 Tax=Allosphingosinicella sp. TaxID=2823234 RepID=UPI002F28060B
MATELKTIRSEADDDARWRSPPRFGCEERHSRGDRLDPLVTLIDAYEATHHAMDAPDPVEAIKFRIEQQGLTPHDLEGAIGTRTQIAEVLNRRRGLSIHTIRRLHSKLGNPAKVLIRPWLQGSSL